MVRLALPVVDEYTKIPIWQLVIVFSPRKLMVNATSPELLDAKMPEVLSRVLSGFAPAIVALFKVRVLVVES